MRRLLAATAAAGLAGSLFLAAPAQAHHCVRSGSGWLGGGVNCTHTGEATIAGPDRYATSAAISATFWEPGEAARVYLANGQTMADAIAAGPSVDGPILLVPTGREVPAVVLAEVARLAPTTAVVRLGGDTAVHPDQLLAASVAAGFDH